MFRSAYQGSDCFPANSARFKGGSLVLQLFIILCITECPNDFWCLRGKEGLKPSFKGCCLLWERWGSTPCKQSSTYVEVKLPFWERKRRPKLKEQDSCKSGCGVRATKRGPDGWRGSQLWCQGLEPEKRDERAQSDFWVSTQEAHENHMPVSL